MNAIVTVCSANDFAYYAPLWVYSAKRAYPDADALVFVRGKPPISGPGIIPGQFDGFPADRYARRGLNAISNSLRFLLGPEHIGKYDLVYITDVDLLVFKPAIDHWQFFGDIMSATNMPIAAVRGPATRPHNAAAAPNGWRGSMRRLAGGTVVINAKPWLKATEKARDYYRQALYTQAMDANYSDDTQPVGTYREWDEVMLARMCRAAGWNVPTTKHCFVNGTSIPPCYRGIHLGDFRYKRRFRDKTKMNRIVDFEICKSFLAMTAEPRWKELANKCTASLTVKQILARAVAYAEARCI